MSEHFSIADAIERRAWTDLLDGAAPATRTRLGLQARPLYGGVALTSRAVEHLLFNRALGLPAEPEALERAAEHYLQQGIERFFLHLAPETLDARLSAALERLGLTRYRRAWVKLVREGGEPPALATPLDVGPARAEEREAGARLLCAAFDLPEEAVPVFAEAAGRPGWEALVARDGERLLGAGFLFFEGDAAYLAGGATRPEARGRGVHAALVAARVRRALEQGCRWIASETGEAVPEEPQHSYRNMIRCGLQPVGRRENFAPAGASWGKSRGDAGAP